MPDAFAQAKNFIAAISSLLIVYVSIIVAACDLAHIILAYTAPFDK